MKQVWTIVVLGIALTLAGCGANSSNGSLNGNWTAALISSNNNTSPNFNFTLTMAEASGSSLSITNLNFTTSSPCFASGKTATGGFTLSGTLNGVTSGGFQMNIQSTVSSNNQLSLQGTINNNTISGNWTLTGTTAGCSGSGTFTMNKS
jgi:hypothetical protein